VTIKSGEIKDVVILSGPRALHSAVKAAMMQYKCVSNSNEIKATQDFIFKYE
jgi:protein TonB